MRPLFDKTPIFFNSNGRNLLCIIFKKDEKKDGYLKIKLERLEMMLTRFRKRKCQTKEKRGDISMVLEEYPDLYFDPYAQMVFTRRNGNLVSLKS